MLASPAQRGGMYGRIPVAGQFVIEAYKSDGAAGHFQRGDVAADEGTRNGNVFATQDALQCIEHDIEFDEWCSTHTIDEGQDLLAGFQTQVFDDRG